MSGQPLPPGSCGLPLIGETLRFAKNPFEFVDSRVAKHGRVFRTSILGQNAAIITGPDAGAAFLDPANCTRIKSQPSHINQLFNGDSLPALDGAEHRTRKELVMAAFNEEAYAMYLPPMQRLIDRAIDRWISRGGEIRWSDELETLAIHVVAANFPGVEDEAALDALRDKYKAMAAAFPAIPVNLPGTKLNRGLKAVRALHQQLLGIVMANRATPGENGLSLMLAAKTDSGATLDNEAAARELHHLVVAGYIVFAEFASGIVQLTRHPGLRQRLTESALARGDELTPAALAADEELQRFIMELKRYTPMLPFVFGRSAREFEFAGYTIPAGWLLLWAITASHRSPHSVYSDPTAFDPERFNESRAEHCRHAHGFAPQGVGGPMTHRCAGVEYSTMFMGAFFSRLLAKGSWELPAQNLELDCRCTPPVLSDGLRARVRARE